MIWDSSILGTGDLAPQVKGLFLQRTELGPQLFPSGSSQLLITPGPKDWTLLAFTGTAQTTYAHTYIEIKLIFSRLL